MLHMYMHTQTYLEIKGKTFGHCTILYPENHHLDTYALLSAVRQQRHKIRLYTLYLSAGVP